MNSPSGLGVIGTRSGAQEQARRHLVTVVMVVYLLAIFEGSLRKYVAPQFGQYIYFIRDPFVVAAYVLATRFGLWPRGQALFSFGLVLCGLGMLLFLLQYMTGGYSEPRLLLGAYGWRSYFLYLPLAFLVGAQFEAQDVARFARVTLVLAVPIAVLVAAQFFSPLDAPINVGTAEEKELQFKGMNINGQRVRATGPFTSVSGQQQFVATALAFLLAMLLMPAQRRRAGWVLLPAAAAALFTCVALSGSRGTMMLSALLGVVALAIGVVGHGSLRAKALTIPLCVGAAAVVLYPVLFPEGFEAFVDRWQHASEYENARIEGGVLGRALLPFFDFLLLFQDVPLLGWGLGYGGNASILMRASIDGVEPGRLAESDFSRHMVDLGPIFGVVYIVYRLALVVWVGRIVWRATRHVPDPLPMMLFGYAGYTIVLGQIAGHGSINVYGWLFLGLCLAASRVALQGPRGRSTALQRLAARMVHAVGRRTAIGSRPALAPRGSVGPALRPRTRHLRRGL